jgi:hypothetical protein
MDRQHNGQKKKNKMTNTDLQNITQKTKDRATRTPIKHEDELRCSGKEGSCCCTYGNRHVTIVTHLVIRHA